MTAVTKPVSHTQPISNPMHIARKRRRLLNQAGVTLLALFLLSIFLMPLAYGAVTSLKSESQATDARAPILPSEVVMYEYEGEEYEVFFVPTEDGLQKWALVDKGRSNSEFVDIANPEAGLIEWQGNWRQLDQVRNLSIHWQNYPEAWEEISFLRLLGNTLMYAFVTMIGTLPLSGQKSPVHHPDFDYHPAAASHAHPDLRLLRARVGVGGDMASADSAASVRQRL
jgi:ABC-type maltose transport system permease subunit